MEPWHYPGNCCDVVKFADIGEGSLLASINILSFVVQSVIQ